MLHAKDVSSCLKTGCPLQMEDRAICVVDLLQDRQGPKLAFYGVYDGHNGDAAVEHVSSRLHQALQAALLTRAVRCVSPESLGNTGPTHLSILSVIHSFGQRLLSGCHTYDQSTFVAI